MSKTLITGLAAAIFAAGLVASASAQMGPNPGDQVDRHDQVDQRGAPNADMRDHQGGDMRDHRDGGWRRHHRQQVCRWRYHHRVCYWR